MIWPKVFVVIWIMKSRRIYQQPVRRIQCTFHFNQKQFEQIIIIFFCISGSLDYILHYKLPSIQVFGGWLHAFSEQLWQNVVYLYQFFIYFLVFCKFMFFSFCLFIFPMLLYFSLILILISTDIHIFFVFVWNTEIWSYPSRTSTDFKKIIYNLSLLSKESSNSNFDLKSSVICMYLLDPMMCWDIIYADD